METVDLQSDLLSNGPRIQRIMILGSGGSGKSTLARRLAAVSSLPIHHLDRLYWKPGWVAADPYEWHTSVSELAAEPRWIIDGNYGDTMDCRLDRADIVAFLDVPRSVCLCRIVGRWAMAHGRVRDDVGAGCPEKLDPEFIRWVWNYPNFSRRILLTRVEHANSNGQFFHLHSSGDVDRFVAAVAARAKRDTVAV
ncbi:MAG TPA: hypothetical protein VGK19_07955 [Capsulimonadaceae bacterium]|jgi:adenylate kinase family enzyme